MSIVIAKIEQLAPDQGSLDAARKLLKPQLWPTLAEDGAGLIWGECQGSGATPYRVVVAEADLGYKCTCPSRKFPCKHSLALMWMRAEGKASFAQGTRPQWAEDWLSRRRGPSEAKAAPAADVKQRPSMAAVVLEEEAAPDPKAVARAEAQRERLQASRESSILNGLDELDQWISDQLERGLASFAADASARCRIVAQRLVDAKAGGLATKIEQIPPTLFGLAENQRNDYLIEALGGLHLIAEAYRRQDDLPAAMKADIRQVVGWSISRDALLGDADALRVSATWMVLAVVSEVQPDKLRRIETWLANLSGQAPNFAVLIDFVPVSGGAMGSALSVGEIIDAEMVFYPGPVPLRALIGHQKSGAQPGGRWPQPQTDIAAAFALYEAALQARPWLGDWPLELAQVNLRRNGDTFWLCDERGLAHMRLNKKTSELAAPLLCVGAMDAFGLWDGREFDLKFAETGLGRWTCN